MLLLLFIASAAVIWFAGIKLSDNTGVLAERLHLGSALGGLILLAIATNLPEIAITASAAVAGQLDVAVGNILGGIAIQTFVLVVLDAAGVRPRMPLTRLAASLVLVLEGALVVVVLAVVVIGTQLPNDLIFARLTRHRWSSPRYGWWDCCWSTGPARGCPGTKAVTRRRPARAPRALPRQEERSATEKGMSTTNGAILTIVFMAGLIFRLRRQYLRMGIDSIAVLVIYLVGIVGLATIGS